MLGSVMMVSLRSQGINGFLVPNQKPDEPKENGCWPGLSKNKIDYTIAIWNVCVWGGKISIFNALDYLNQGIWKLAPKWYRFCFFSVTLSLLERGNIFFNVNKYSERETPPHPLQSEVMQPIKLLSFQTLSCLCWSILTICKMGPSYKLWLLPLVEILLNCSMNTSEYRQIGADWCSLRFDLYISAMS